MSAAMHLAQFSWSTLRADPVAPEIAVFVDALDRVHAIAERSAGFVWRLGGETAAAKAIGWPMFLSSDRISASFSVWRDAAALERFVHRTAHGAYFFRGGEWFEPGAGANLALWIVPRGHTPDIAEARERVEHLIAHGPTERAFDLARARRSGTGAAPAARQTRGEPA